jgi:hypothetical protein
MYIRNTNIKCAHMLHIHTTAKFRDGIHEYVHV